jgi:hypothetical protein
MKVDPTQRGAVALARMAGKPDWNALMDHEQARYLAQSEAFLAAVIPAIQAAERERIARVLETRTPYATDLDRARSAAAIRAMGDEHQPKEPGDEG